MMKIYKSVSIILTLLYCALSAEGAQYKFVKRSNTFTVVEGKEYYEVICSREDSSPGSKNKNILDRQLRMDAVDLIGAYILFKKEHGLSENLFQVYVEGINLHYNAYVEGITREEKILDGQQCICYKCSKDKYHIESSTYNTRVDIPALIESNYTRSKNESSATLLYEYEGFTAEQYIRLEHDFLTGAAKLPTEIRVLQNISDRFEKSVFCLDDENLMATLKTCKQSIPNANPYRQFCLEEYLTACPAAQKATAFKMWKESLDSPHCVWEEFLAFCASYCAGEAISDNATFTEVISAYPGGISPFGIRQPLDNTSYNSAASAYAKSEFNSAVTLLTEAIDNEGISSRSLNLLGASYRFLEKPQMAIPYLLLGFKLDPKTTYLAGNIVLCAKMMNFPKTSALAEFLTNYATDDWSRQELSAHTEICK